MNIRVFLDMPVLFRVAKRCFGVSANEFEEHACVVAPHTLDYVQMQISFLNPF